jgi:tRNA-splicing ligase RtcB
VYTVHAHDARELADDFARIGFAASTYRRARGAGRQDEYCVRVHSVALHALFAALGSPVGRKRWPAEAMPWLFALPPWMRAQVLSGFASAEMSTPRLQPGGAVANLALKQAGEDDHAIRFAARLCESLGFEVSVAPSGRAYGDRQVHVLQVLGGQHAQLAFFEQVGFCHARDKRAAAARVAGAVWAHERCVATREHAKAEARARHGAGEPWRRVVDEVSTRFGVEPGFVYHAIYDRRGSARRPPGVVLEPDATAEVCWTPVVDVVEGPEAPVYDVVTGDPAECFVAAGVVVHNCGNAAIRTDLTLADLGETPERVRARLEATADEIQAAVSFGMGRRNRADDAPVDDPLFMDEAWHAVPRAERKDLKHKARQQLGTVGSGNHYVDVFADEAGTLWVGVHFGSRGFGHTVASAFLAMGQGKRWGERAPEREVLLDVTAPLGHDYWHLMNLAGRYAYAGREWVARKVLQLMGAREVELVHNHHNFAWREEHGGEELLVVRKGATPAFPGQRGFVGGSMGDDAVIVEGVTAADDEAAAAQRAALYSTIHGAGRVLSRTAAAGKRNRKTGAIIKPGLVTPEMMHGWLRERGVILRGGGLDEAPQAYRRLPEVLAAQEGTVAVRHVLRPLVVVMAGADEFDPYKD